MAAEQVILREGQVVVSNTRVVVGGTTYALANLTSVSKHVVSPKTSGQLALAATGAMIALCGFFYWLIEKVRGCLFLVLLGAGVTIWAVLASKRVKPTFAVQIQISSGQAQALESPNESLIDRVVEAISQAITLRG